jgi:WD40 repeat protein
MDQCNRQSCCSGLEIDNQLEFGGQLYREVLGPLTLRVVTASADKTVRLWDGASGKVAAQFDRRRPDAGNFRLLWMEPEHLSAGSPFRHAT